jgi:hypothetical protein
MKKTERTKNFVALLNLKRLDRKRAFRSTDDKLFKALEHFCLRDTQGPAAIAFPSCKEKLKWSGCEYA